MVETTTKVWVRTSALDTAVYGKSKNASQRSIPGASLSNDDDGALNNWGWARGRIVHDDSHSHSHSHSSIDNLEYKENEEIKVFVQDRDSSHNETEVKLKGSAIQNGDLLMDNIYGDGAIDEETDDEDSDDDYYYDDDEFGGGNSSNDNGAGKYPDDLITLTHLHEPSVVYCLRKRYAYDKIYTSTGPILIAMNPFKNCKSLYSDTVMKKYWDRGESSMMGITPTSSSEGGRDQDSKPNRGDGDVGMDDTDNLPPHVYSIADHSFRKMMTTLEEGKKSESSSGGRRRRAAGGNNSSPGQGCNQSILVSGESGAGKTVTTKFIMQYLATLSKRSSVQTNDDATSSRSSQDKADIEQQVLQSNPILESFGNARTVRNDNSSRFGKFIEIQFTRSGHLAGASIETYLLEKVRLVTQTEGERNYHIFYELLEGLSDEEYEQYFLGDYTMEDFKMTNQSGTYDRRDGVSDFDTFKNLNVAMETMGFSVAEKSSIIGITCAMLHASNLGFISISADESEIDKTNDHLEPVLSLLGLTADDLNRALCYFSITAGRETHMRSNSKEKAEKGLLALIKATYGALFTYIVRRVNESITIEHKGKSRNDNGNAVAASIGVLDIFGFESFQSNSFEQLCINYCNEALQQQFNLFVLKNEQEEYEREGIKWSFISFPDNQDVLDLIDKKGVGILNILDDQCRAPGTTDKTFINDLYQKLSRHRRFQADYRQVGSRKFAIIHYAGNVEYSSEGFLEKNRDDLPKEATELLQSSSNSFLRQLANIIQGLEGAGKENKTRTPQKSSKKSKSTVGGQFSRQLQELRQKIDLTNPHYIRCLKPNDELVPNNFNPLIVSDQLRCAGVIEAVRVSRVGYPQRYSHARFLARYRLLGRKITKGTKPSRRQKPIETLVETIVLKMTQAENAKNGGGDDKSHTVDLVSAGIQVGKSKVFLRRKAFETIERMRNLEMRVSAIKIQSIMRRYLVQREFKESRSAAIVIQCLVRKRNANRTVCQMRRNFRAKIIQNAYRRYAARRVYLATYSCALTLQRLHRGNVGRERFTKLNRERKTLVVQKNWRMFRQAKQYRSMRAAAITLQCARRCMKARRRFMEVKKAARDLANTAQERDRLRQDSQKLGKALHDASIKIANLESALNDEKSKNEILAKSRSDLQISLQDETAKIEKIKAALEKSIMQNETLEVEHTELKEQIRKLEDSYAMKEKEIVDCISAIEKLKDEAIAQNSNLIESEAMYQGEIKGLRDEAQKLGDDLLKSEAKYQKEIEDLRNEVKEFDEDLNDALSKIANLESALDDEMSKNKSFEYQLAEAKSDAQMSMQDETAKVEKIEAALAESVSQNEALEAEHIKLRERMRQLEESHTMKDKDIEDYRSTIEKLKDEAVSQNSNLIESEAKYQGEITGLQDETQMLRTSLEKLEKELEDSNVKILDIESKASARESTLINEMASAKEENNLLSLKLSTVDTDNARLLHEIQDLKAQMENMTNKKVEDDSTHAKEREEMAVMKYENEKISKEVQGLQNQLLELDCVKSENSRLLGEIQNLRSQNMAYDSMKSDNESLLDEFKNLSSQFNTMVKFSDEKTQMKLESQELRNQLARMSNVENQNEYLQTEVQDLQNRLELMIDVEKENIRLSTEIQDVCSQIDTMKEGLMEQLQENEKLKGDLKQQRSQLEELASLKSDKENLASEVEGLRSQLDTMNDLKSANEELLKEINSLRSEIDAKDRIENENKQLFEEVKDLRSQVDNISDVTGEVEDLHNQLNEMEGVRNEVKDLRSQLDAMVDVASKNKELSSEVENLRQKLDHMGGVENKNEQLLGQVDDLHLQLEKLEKDLQDLEEDNERLKSEAKNGYSKAGEVVRVRSEEDSFLSFDSDGLTNKDSVSAELRKELLRVKEETQKCLEVKNKEIARLQEEVSHLQEDLEKSTPGNESPPDKEVERLRRRLKESKKISAEEILTLQDEVERLNAEITTLKIDESSRHSSVAPQPPQDKPQINGDPNGDQISKLIDSVMAKDEEIRDLRREIAILRDQVDTATMSVLTESVSHRFVDDDDRSVVSRIFGRSPAPRITPSLSGTENKDIAQLKSINENLRKELEAITKERDELKVTLEGEQTRATRELAAFGDALRQVDELRQAAELMSREITRLKNQNDDEVPLDPFEEVCSLSDEAVQNFENAKKSIGQASSTDPSPQRTGRRQRGLWGKIVQTSQRVDDKNSRERRRDKDVDDRSILSSFF